MSRRTQWGLTLVEILVVTAIVLLLLGGIVGLYRYGLRRSKATACLSNLRQIGLGIGQYAEASDGLVPPYSFVTHQDRLGRLVKANGTGYKESLEPYGVEDFQFYCLLDDYAKSVGRHGREPIDHTDTSYEWSGVESKFGTVGVPFISLRLSDIPRPAESKAVYDASLDFDLDGKGTPTGHGMKANVLYYDWHVKSESTVGPFCHFPGQNEGCPE